MTCRKVYAAVGREKVRKSRQHTEHKRAAEWLKKAKEQERKDFGGEVESDTSTESLTSSQVEAEEERVRQWQQAMLAHEEKRRAQKYKETERCVRWWFVGCRTVYTVSCNSIRDVHRCMCSLDCAGQNARVDKHVHLCDRIHTTFITMQ